MMDRILGLKFNSRCQNHASRKSVQLIQEGKVVQSSHLLEAGRLEGPGPRPLKGRATGARDPNQVKNEGRATGEAPGLAQQ